MVDFTGGLLYVDPTEQVQCAGGERVYRNYSSRSDVFCHSHNDNDANEDKEQKLYR
jgi:hypothetical protein